jgi:hypothetical protein
MGEHEVKQAERMQLIEEMYQKRIKVLNDKGAAYAEEGDINYNFKIIAKILGLTPFQVWAVYWLKHVICVANAIKKNPNTPIDTTEGMEGRIIDNQNYIDILVTLLEELEQDKYGEKQ